MRKILRSNNLDILHEINLIRQSLNKVVIPQALNGYREWILTFLDEKEQMVQNNLYYLNLNEDSILSEVLERTQSVTRNVRVLSAKYISPLSRYSKSDNLSIMVLEWLHDQHPQSTNTAFAVSDGNFAIYPTTDIPIIYFLPASSQKSLLHLPLFLHEFGHYLFRIHFKEMTDYIITMQDGLEELLLPPYQQNDAKSQLLRKKTKNIVETWFDWIEEIFCDIVGLTIGGPSFLKTFSLYLRMSGRTAFYVNEKELENSSHPVSWLRIRFLVDRAKQMGFGKEAAMVEDEWKKMATLMNVTPIYHGYYHESYKVLIDEALNYMLEEASPIKYADCMSANELNGLPNFVQLAEKAWALQETDQQAFEAWQADILRSYESMETLIATKNNASDNSELITDEISLAPTFQ